MSDKFPFSKEEFDAIYSKVPRLCVDVVLKSPEGIYLTKRSIEPCKGQWHLPGGTVYFGESLQQAAKRVINRELGISINNTKQIGVIEFRSHYQHGLDHPVSIALEVTAFDGTITPNPEAEAGNWFKQMPEPMHADQKEFLKSHGLLS